MEFIRKLFNFGRAPKAPASENFRGAAPVQSKEEQDATRERMEGEMASQKERREAHEPEK